MGKILIIAEKPSQGREYAKTLGVRGKGEGFLENEHYVITWCYGHLLELERPEAYMDLTKVGKRWGLHRLPVLPEVHAFRRNVKASARKQYEIIQKWLQSAEIDQVICGTDADREGQLLFQEVWDASKCRKPLSRLWISSLTAEAIQEGLRQLRSAESVSGLAEAGYGRALADWNFGMNLTEGFTSLLGSFDSVSKKPNVISVGRVQTPTLALVVEREWEIERFTPEAFFEVKADFTAIQGGYVGRWFDPNEDLKRITKREDAEKIVTQTQGKAGQVHDLNQKEVSDLPLLLFDLTSLTVAASKRYGFSAERVLQLAQALYEKKAITYPRTDCAYLSPDVVTKLPQHLQAVRQEPYIALVDEAKQLGVPKGKRVIQPITAHHAIIPTTEKVSYEKLAEGEQKLYDLIVRRFLAIWFPSARYQQTEVITIVDGEYFRTKGKVMLSPGWKRVYESDDSNTTKTSEEENTLIPPLHSGEEVQAHRVFVDEKSTKPPKRYTQGDLLKAMESAGKQIDDEVLRQQLKGKGLGTVATRPAILEALLERGYIIQEQKSLRPTEKGIELIRVIKDKLPKAQLLISADMTGQMEYDLARVEQGEISLKSYMTEVERAIRYIINELRSYEKSYGKTPIALARVSKVKVTKIDNKSKTRTRTKGNSESLGACPRCGAEIIIGQKGYGCSKWRDGCRFVIWKTPICGKTLTANQIKALLKKGKTPLIKGFKSKSGKVFSAYLIWEDREQGKLKFLFE